MARDADSLYRQIEEQVVPLFYDRDGAAPPRGWVERMKRSIATLAWRYNADRMVADYVRHGYLAAGGRLSADW